MAITRTFQVRQTGNGTTRTLAVSGLTQGDLCVVMAAATTTTANIPTLSISDDMSWSAWSEATNEDTTVNGNKVCVSIFTTTVGADGTGNITVTSAQSAHYFLAEAHTLTNANATVVQSAKANGDINGGVLTCTLGSAPASTSLCLGIIAASTTSYGNATSIAAQNSFTEINEAVAPSAGAIGTVVQTQERTGSTSTSCGWDTTTDDYNTNGLVVEIAETSSSVTGTVAATMAAFTSTASGSSVTGTSATTLGAFSPSASGGHGVAGTTAATLAAFTSTASGSTVTGTVAATLAAFAPSASGTHSITGTVAATLAAFTSTASGSSVTGTTAATMASFTSTASGSVGGTVTFLQQTSSTVDGSSYTFAGQNLGAAASDRYIIVTTETRASSTTTITINSITVGGVSATIVAQVEDPATNNMAAGIAIAAVPTGTTGDVVVTFSRTVLRCNIGVYRAVGLASATPTDTGTSIASTSTTNLDVVAGGFAIANGGLGASGASAAWTNIDETYDVVVETFMGASGALRTYSTAQSGLAISATWSGTTQENWVATFASWGFGDATVTGTVAATMGAFTSSASGTATPPTVTGTVAATLAAFTSTASGTHSVTGTSAVTLDAFIATTSGTAFEAITGTATVTLASFTSTASGAHAELVTGTVAVTLGAFTSDATGTALGYIFEIGTVPTSVELSETELRAQGVDRRWARLVGQVNMPRYSLLKINGTYTEIRTPSTDQMASATEVYQGGHRYRVSGTTATALTSAGYGAWLTLESA